MRRLPVRRCEFAQIKSWLETIAAIIKWSIESKICRHALGARIARAEHAILVDRVLALALAYAAKLAGSGAIAMCFIFETNARTKAGSAAETKGKGCETHLGSPILRIAVHNHLSNGGGSARASFMERV